jgi:hypothetical protein
VQVWLLLLLHLLHLLCEELLLLLLVLQRLRCLTVPAVLHVRLALLATSLLMNAVNAALLLSCANAAEHDTRQEKRERRLSDVTMLVRLH